MSDGKTEWIDLDKDNDLDLIMTGSDGAVTLTVVYENVAGALTQRSTNLPALTAFASADYDRDGDTDLVAFDQQSEFTRLYRNDGNFVFSEGQSLGSFAPSVAVWLDIDNDEDLDVLFSGRISVPLLFENTGVGFVEIPGTEFPECPGCNCDVADINGDGKVDIMFTGDVTALYLNAGNKQFLADESTTFRHVFPGNISCGDLGGDGDFDILLTGLVDGNAYTAVYENVNNRLVERTNLGLTPMYTHYASSSLWFNINNDGKPDIFIAGRSDPGNVFSDHAAVFRNEGGSFTDIQDAYLAFDGYQGSYDAGDYDNDGDLDLGFQGTYVVLAGFPYPFPTLRRMAGYYRHGDSGNGVVSNTQPLPPSVATFSEEFFRKEIRLKWAAGSDTETPAGGLMYNFYLRDANKKLILPSVDFSTGALHASKTPNCMGRAGYAFDMPEGMLTYAVQSIDGGKRGSAFSAEKTFYHFNGPEAVKVSFTDQQHATLTWIDHSTLETNFEVLRKGPGTTAFTSLAVLPKDSKGYNDNFTFATETEYQYRIRGYNGQASVYDSLMLVIPERAGNVMAQAINAATIKLTWTDQSQYETAYIIERRQGTGQYARVATLDPDVTQFTDGQLSDGATYEYRVTAQGANGALAPLISAVAKTNARPIGMPFTFAADEDHTLVMSSSAFMNHFSDADPGDKLVKIRITSLPENGTLFVYTSRAAVGQEVTPDLFDYMEFVPWQDFAGTTTLEVVPYDGRDYATNKWIVTLKMNQVNDEPAFLLSSVNIALSEDFAGTAQVYAQRQYIRSEESEVVSYTISPATSDLVNVLIDPSTGVVSFNSKKDKWGELEFTIKADDGQAANNTYSQKLRLQLQPVNDATGLGPVADIEAETLSTTVNLAITDPDGNTAASMFSATSSNTTIVKPEKIQFNKNTDGQMTMTISAEGKMGDTNIQVSVQDGNFLVSRQFRFSMMLITAIDEGKGDEFLVFPNPVVTELYIEGSNEGERRTFIVRDMQGRTVQSGVIYGAVLTIDMSGQAPGIYYVESAGRTGIVSRKIVKL